ncbi:amidohydrolase [Cereibacter sphaeroides]|uniref:amidohydrolase family protein n=1 Tax=Cereibacter sphaeroides TaxID=1063 RepID=UPI000F52795F|nr:amidohydrolase family protein [Cereibacter sphaeroides]AZB57443.1 amidohydrolase [Cereibacter sphaeroides]AZB61718.1 amidohydrolase [Cereibacter sphaeroides]
MLIDFSSRPPHPDFSPPAPHLENYRRVYRASERRSAASDAAQGLDSWLETYERLGARHVVLKARDLTTTFGFRISNEAVAEFIRAHGPRYVGFAGVDPWQEDAVDRFDHAIRHLGLRGLNLQCFELKMRPDDERLFPLYEKAIELDVPVNIHCGINFSTHTSMALGRPEYLDNVMVRYPELRAVASPPGWPWVQELIGVAWRHPNLSIGVLAVRPKLLAKAHSGYEPLLQYGRTLLKEKIIFGSAFPMMPVETALAELDGLGLDADTRRLWLHDNAARLLGLDTAAT